MLCLGDSCALQDLHEPQVVAALTRLCTASLQLQPIQGLLQEVEVLSQGKQGSPHGQLQLRLKRHTGRVRVEAELYSLHQDGSLHTSAVPQEAITAQLLAAHAVQHAGQFSLSSSSACPFCQTRCSAQLVPGCRTCSYTNACSSAVQRTYSCSLRCLHLCLKLCTTVAAMLIL